MSNWEYALLTQQAKSFGGPAKMLNSITSRGVEKGIEIGYKQGLSVGIEEGIKIGLNKSTPLVVLALAAGAVGTMAIIEGYKKYKSHKEEKPQALKVDEKNISTEEEPKTEKNIYDYKNQSYSQNNSQTATNKNDNKEESLCQAVNSN